MHAPILAANMGQLLQTGVDFMRVCYCCCCHLQMHMDLNIDKAGVKRSLVDRVRESIRQQRYKLHQHFLKYPDLQEAKDHKPKTCPDKDNWKSSVIILPHLNSRV